MSKRLFVGGLPYDMTEDKMFEIFTACGRVEKVKIMVDRATGRSKGFGFIEMATETEGLAAILKFDGSNIGPRRISVKEAQPAENHRKPGGGRPDNRNRRPGPGNNRGNGGRPGAQRPPRGNGGGFSGPRPPRDNSGGNGEQRQPSGNGGGYGEQRPPRSNGSYGEQRPPRGNGGGYSEQRPPRSNGYGGGSQERNGRPSGPGGFGGGQGRKPFSKPGGGHTPGSRERGSSDWRSELGINNNNQRKDFRRSSRDHNSRDNGRQQRGDDFGNR